MFRLSGKKHAEQSKRLQAYMSNSTLSGREFAWLPTWTANGWAWLQWMTYREACGVRAYWKEVG